MKNLSLETSLRFLGRSLIALTLGIVIATLCGILGAMVGGNLPTPENLRLGSQAGYEVTGLLGFWAGYCLWISNVSDWVLKSTKRLVFHWTYLVIVLLETSGLYHILLAILSKTQAPSLIATVTLCVGVFFIVPLGSIWAWSKYEK